MHYLLYSMYSALRPRWRANRVAVAGQISKTLALTANQRAKILTRSSRHGAQSAIQRRFGRLHKLGSNTLCHTVLKAEHVVERLKPHHDQFVIQNGDLAP